MVLSRYGSSPLVPSTGTANCDSRVSSLAWCRSGSRGSPAGRLFSLTRRFIGSWNTKLARESFRITVELGGLGSGADLFVWSLLSLSNGTLVSADSTGSVQFWDAEHETIFQAHSYLKGETNALAALATIIVFSTGSDGQVILYKFYCEPVESIGYNCSTYIMKRLIYVGYIRAHSHDVRTLTVAVPIKKESISQAQRTQGKKICKIFVQWGFGLASDSNSVGDMESMPTHKVPWLSA